MAATGALAKYNVLVYAAEKKGIAVPTKVIEGPRYVLSFAAYDDIVRFQEFDGIIVFQGTFESFELIRGGYSRSTTVHRWDRDQLDKRTKELLSLLDKGGMACFLLDQPFVEFGEHGEDFSDTDLSKRALIAYDLDPDNFGDRVPIIRSHVDEFRRFFELYGAAWSVIRAKFGTIGAKTIGSHRRHPVAVVSSGRVFFIPMMVPDSVNKVEEFLTVLADAVVSTWEKLREDCQPGLTNTRYPERLTLQQAGRS